MLDDGREFVAVGFLKPEEKTIPAPEIFKRIRDPVASRGDIDALERGLKAKPTKGKPKAEPPFRGVHILVTNMRNGQDDFLCFVHDEQEKDPEKAWRRAWFSEVDSWCAGALVLCPIAA